MKWLEFLGEDQDQLFIVTEISAMEFNPPIDFITRTSESRK